MMEKMIRLPHKGSFFHARISIDFLLKNYKKIARVKK